MGGSMSTRGSGQDSTLPAGSLRRESTGGPAGQLSYLYRPGEGGTALLMLHPVNTSALVWTHVVSELDPRWPVIAVDYRAHGRSDAGGRYLPADYAADALAVVDHLGVDRAHLVCGSIGGAVSVEIAAVRPELVASISAFGAGLRIGWTGEVVEATGEQLRTMGVSDWFRAHGGEVLGPASRPEAAQELAYLASDGREVETVIEVIRGTFQEADSRPAARAVSAAPPPAQVVAGACDPTCPPSVGQELASALNCSVTVLAEIGHLPMLEDPVKTARLLHSFLEELEPAS